MTQPTEAGVARYLAALCGDQLARGWHVVVACPDGGELAVDLERGGVPRMAWPATRSPDAHAIPEALRLRRLLDQVAPDIVHLHSSKAGLAGRLAIRGRLPTLFQPHGWSWLAAPRAMAGATLAWERLAARWTTRYLCVGEGEARQARERGLRGRYSVVRSGVDLQRFQPASRHDRAAARRALGISDRVPLAVCVGRVTRQKGQDLLLAAWPLVRDRCPEGALALLGEGDLTPPLRRLGLPGVAFLGAVADVRPWYAAADLVVLPSRWEGLPLTLLEALAVGRPVVGSDVPGITGELPAGAGALVPVGDVAGLAEAVAARLCHPEAARAEGATAARYALAEADVRRTHDALCAVTAVLAGASVLPGAHVVDLHGAGRAGGWRDVRVHEVVHDDVR